MSITAEKIARELAAGILRYRSNMEWDDATQAYKEEVLDEARGYVRESAILSLLAEPNTGEQDRT